MIIVTPVIVNPVRDPAALQQPDRNYTPPTDLERILLLRQVGRTRRSFQYICPVQPDSLCNDPNHTIFTRSRRDDVFDRL